LLRYEVIVDEVADADAAEADRDWCSDAEIALLGNYEGNGWDMYGSHTFDNLPYVAVEVEVDDSDLEGKDLDSTAVAVLFDEQLQEDEAASPSWVVDPPAKTEQDELSS
jgi:hypothetical protein